MASKMLGKGGGGGGLGRGGRGGRGERGGSEAQARNLQTT